MRKTCEEFFAARLPIPGLAACGVRLPDGLVIHQSFNRWLTPMQIRQAMDHLAQTSEILQHQQIEPVRMTWVFEHLRVYLRLRPDTACLALFVENRPELVPSELERVLEEFAGLPMLAQE
jgi:hypothetical protein